VAAAKAAGASRVLYTSLPKPDVSVISFAFEHLASEKAVIDSGLAYTIFRNGWYAENLFMSLPQALKSGQWFTSAGDGRVAYGARDDLAAAIAAGLASDEPGNRIHTLTGPELFTTAEVASLASQILGKPITVVQLTDEQLADGLRQHGLPDPVVDVVVSIDANTRGGFLDFVTDDVEKLSGRKSQTLKSFLEANKAQSRPAGVPRRIAQAQVKWRPGCRSRPRVPWGSGNIRWRRTPSAPARYRACPARAACLNSPPASANAATGRRTSS
jgi:NAD(P)H dehydrogenase (quinone)